MNSKKTGTLLRAEILKARCRKLKPFLYDAGLCQGAREIPIADMANIVYIFKQELLG